MFPNAIEHTLQWARDMFEGVFRQSAESAAHYLIDPMFMDRTLKLAGSQPLDTLELVKKALVDERPADFRACVKWARLHWQEQFHDKIVQLLHDLPPKKLTSTGNYIAFLLSVVQSIYVNFFLQVNPSGLLPNACRMLFISKSTMQTILILLKPLPI